MTGRSFASEPLTGMPRATMMRATADMPTPPMPMKCTRPRDSRERVPCWGWVIALLLPDVLGPAVLGLMDCRFQDEVGHAPVRVADAEVLGAGGHPGQPVLVQQQRDDVARGSSRR